MARSSVSIFASSCALAILSASDARAQTCTSNWADCNRAFTHVANAMTGDDSAVSSTLKAWGPSDEVFVGIERRNDLSLVHGFFLRGYTCQSASCGSYDLTYDELADPVGDEIRCDRILQPAMSVTAHTGERHVDVAMRTRADVTAPNCGSSTTDYAAASCLATQTEYLDLDHVQWDTSGSWNDEILEASLTEFSGGSLCEDRGRPFLRTNGTNNLMRACWRFNDEPNNGLDEIHCAQETSGAYHLDDLSNLVGQSARVQEHVAMDLDGDDRIAIHRSKEFAQGGDFVIRVRFVEDTNDPSVPLAADDDADHPDFTVSSTGKYWAVWTEGTGSGSEIHLATCTPSGGTTCKSNTHWTPAGTSSTTTLAITGHNLKHPNLTTDGNRVFLVWMEDVDTGAGVQHRVRFASRCSAPGSFNDPSPETILTPATAGRDQSLFHGRPNIGADRTADRVHVAFVEGGTIEAQTDQADDGDVWWASRSYSSLTACP